METFKKFPTAKPITDWVSAEAQVRAFGQKGFAKYTIFFGEKVHLLVALSKSPEKLEEYQEAVESFKEVGAEEDAASAETTKEPGSRKLPEDFRTWKDTTGKFEIEAKLKQLGDEDITLETCSGKVIDVPVKKLCAEDQSYLEEIK